MNTARIAKILTTAALALASTAFAQPGNQAPLQVAKPNYVSIHMETNVNKPAADCVLHVHPQYLTALSMLQNPEMALAHHNNLVLNDRVVVDVRGDEPVDNNEEGDRIAELKDELAVVQRESGTRRARHRRIGTACPPRGRAVRTAATRSAPRENPLTSNPHAAARRC